MDKTTQLLTVLKKVEEEANKFYSKIEFDLNPDFFEKEKWSLKKNESNELNFKNVIFHLYKLYYERGELNISVVAGFAHLCNIEESDILGIKKEIHAFRTSFVHYLNDESKRTKEIKQTCKLWYDSALSNGKIKPDTESDWQKCVNQIIEQAVMSLNKVNQVLGIIVEKNEEVIFEQWLTKQKSKIPFYVQESILEQIKNEYELNYDSQILRTKKQSIFEDGIKLIDFGNGKIVEQNLKPIFEKIVMGLDVFPCPLSGTEVQQQFSLDDKKLLGQIMKRITAYHSEKPETTKEELLELIIKEDLLSLQ